MNFATAWFSSAFSANFKFRANRRRPLHRSSGAHEWVSDGVKEEEGLLGGPGVAGMALRGRRESEEN
jgi:hypothetical protein